ncbi:hypothetical protein OIU76_011577 [Salix suchowensis]|nr:hypothetical protein OIU76_011577 [Salix suchowensis]
MNLPILYYFISGHPLTRQKQTAFSKIFCMWFFNKNKNNNNNNNRTTWIYTVSKVKRIAPDNPSSSQIKTIFFSFSFFLYHPSIQKINRQSTIYNFTIYTRTSSPVRNMIKGVTAQGLS